MSLVKTNSKQLWCFTAYSSSSFAGHAMHGGIVVNDNRRGLVQIKLDFMKRVLVIHYSQSGQLTNIVRSFLRPLIEAKDIEIVWEELQPAQPYPFPWPLYRFFDVRYEI
jgi:hypothetical protein